MKRVIVHLLCLFTTLIGGFANAQQVILPQAYDDKSSLALSVIQSALQVSEQRSQVSIADHQIAEQGLADALKSHEISLFWASTTNELETEFFPVRVPLLKGIDSYQILLCRAESIPELNLIRHAGQLRQYKMGVLNASNNANVFQRNGLNTVATSKWQNLVYMLDGQRFDIMATSVFDIAKIQALQNQVKYPINASTLQGTLISYLAPTYIFTNNAQLAEQIKQGLELLIESKQLDAILNADDSYRQALALLDEFNGEVIQLQSQLQANVQPLARPELWVHLANQSLLAKN
ncbi:hypothetical protein C2869_10160 [Saccharobesus litoralis]|uniref:Solute-binding protein family 3/N-terminal domain-containing protein n=1 Tax=Saccharobesus litoralis TaxID=2172099 RepID=A0A2S0VRB9_9ALTE|nr:hypothetical protein [Saccharobesus litoralis]AWB66766.1 hypothetical protein C2869_10160 [Saccharobesus litoralis]